MTIEFRDYPLAGLETGLTVRHPTLGYPVWAPAVGLRLALVDQVSVEHLSRRLADALLPFWDWFADEFRWRTGPKAGRWVKTNARDALKQIVAAPLGEWGQTFAGGAEKLQAHPVKCTVASWLHLGKQFVGALTLSVPIPWFIANESAFLQWIDDLCERLPVQGGHVGLCGVGGRGFPSKWNACEFFILQRYFGIDPCDEAQLGPSTPMHEGYIYSPQWITLLGAQACERLGGVAAIESAAIAAKLRTSVRNDILKLQSSQALEPGFDRWPAGLAAMNKMLKPNRGNQFFIGHSFEMYQSDALGTTNESASSMWAERFDGETGQSARWPGVVLAKHSIDVGSTLSGNVWIRCDVSAR